jgi:hypothetical protein
LAEATLRTPGSVDLVAGAAGILATSARDPEFKLADELIRQGAEAAQKRELETRNLCSLVVIFSIGYYPSGAFLPQHS